MIRYGLILIFCAVLLFPVLVLKGCNKQSSLSSEEYQSERTGFILPQKHTTNLTREKQRGQGLYEYYCALCHGKTGEADGFNAFNMSTQPAKHTDAILMGTLSDTQIQLIIREGGSALGRSPQMPPWGGVLTDQEISDLTDYIRTLAKPGGN